MTLVVPPGYYHALADFEAGIAVVYREEWVRDWRWLWLRRRVRFTRMGEVPTGTYP